MAGSFFWQRSDDLSEVEKAVIGDTVPTEAIEVHCEYLQPNSEHIEDTSSIPAESLTVEKQYKAKHRMKQASNEVTFVYAWHLVKSPYSNDIKKGISLLKELCQHGHDQRDYLFYISLGSYRLEDYDTARSFIERLLQFEPHNRQAKQLEQLINRKQRRDGLLGVALVGGTALVASAAAAIIGIAVARKISN